MSSAGSGAGGPDGRGLNPPVVRGIHHLRIEIHIRLRARESSVSGRTQDQNDDHGQPGPMPLTEGEPSGGGQHQIESNTTPEQGSSDNVIVLASSTQTGQTPANPDNATDPVAGAQENNPGNDAAEERRMFNDQFIRRLVRQGRRPPPMGRADAQFLQDYRWAIIGRRLALRQAASSGSAPPASAYFSDTDESDDDGADLYIPSVEHAEVPMDSSEATAGADMREHHDNNTDRFPPPEWFL